MACGQNLGSWIMKSGLWRREGRTTCFSGGQGPGKVGGVQRAGRLRMGAGSPTRFWKRGCWGPAAWPSPTSVEDDATGRGGGKGVRGGDGGVAPRCRNLALAGPKDPEGEAALDALRAAAPMGCADLAGNAPSRAAQGSLYPDATRRHVRG